MAQEVRLQGRTYSDVPSILLPDSNNVFHPFTDVSDTTATAPDVTAGKYFYLADGTRTRGTGTGGGGGLEYETGTYSPTVDTSNPEIPFSNVHTSPPVMVMIADATGTVNSTAQNYGATLLANFYAFTGEPIKASNTVYALGYTRYTASNGGSWTGTVGQATGTVSISDYVTNTGFKPSINSSSRYWRAGRSYKWIAVWRPTP